MTAQAARRISPAVTASVAVLVAALAALAMYLPTLKYELVWDDRALVVENPELATANPLRFFGQSFTHSWAMRGLVPHSYYRPLVVMSLWLDYKLWHLRPLGYHLTNVLWNGLAAALAALLGLALFGSFWPALLVGLGFALHPAHVESVAFVSGRTDLMMAVFLLAGVLMLMRFRTRPGLVLGAGVVAAFALSLLCKEAAAVFPVFGLLYLGAGSARLRLRRADWVLLATLAVVAGLYLLLRALVLRGPQPAWGDVSVAQRLLLVLNALGRYAAATLVPFWHRLSYPDLVAFARPGWPTFAGIAALAVASVAAWRARRNAVGLGSAWFLLFLLPASNFFPPGPSYLSERLLYLPSLGAVLVAVALAREARGKARRVLAVAGLLLCTGMAANSVQRMPVWTDELSLARAMVQERQSDPEARAQLARTMLERGMTAAALPELRAALRLDPNRGDLRFELAHSLKSSGDLAGARTELDELARRSPEHPGAQSLLGTVLLEQGDARAALPALQAAVRQSPGEPMAHNNLGVALDQLGRVAEAEQEFRQALTLQPDLAFARNNMGEILMRRGDWAGAEAEFRQALAGDPDYGLAHYNLGLMYEKQGRRREATAELLRAGELMPGFPGVEDGLRRVRQVRP